MSSAAATCTSVLCSERLLNILLEPPQQKIARMLDEDKRLLTDDGEHRTIFWTVTDKGFLEGPAVDPECCRGRPAIQATPSSGAKWL
jgi:hypothetical protein